MKLKPSTSFGFGMQHTQLGTLYGSLTAQLCAEITAHLRMTQTGHFSSTLKTISCPSNTYVTNVQTDSFQIMTHLDITPNGLFSNRYRPNITFKHSLSFFYIHDILTNATDRMIQLDHFSDRTESKPISNKSHFYFGHAPNHEQT